MLRFATPHRRIVRVAGHLTPRCCATLSDLPQQFSAMVVEADAKGGNLKSNTLVTVTSPSELSFQDPSVNDTVTIRVKWSNLNYKDGMIVQGHAGLVHRYPIVPGIDAAGTIIATDNGEQDTAPPDGAATSRPGLPYMSGQLPVGTEVTITGNKIGQHFDGGFSQVLRVKREWVLPRPRGFSLKETMMIGSAGITAMQCVMHLEDAGELHPSTAGDVLVTGAAGGLGSIAVAILSTLGYNVVASTGRTEELGDYLRSLGAKRVIGRVKYNPTRPLGDQLWSGCVDTVGGDTLAAVVTQTKYGCAIASTGVAGGGSLLSSVYPFILRRVRLLGVDSTLPFNVEGYAPEDNHRWLAERHRLWKRLDSDLDRDKLHRINVHTIGLTEVEEWSHKILAGKVQGRVVVDCDK